MLDLRGQIPQVNNVRDNGDLLRAEIMTAKASTSIAFSVQREETSYVNVPAGILEY